MTADTHWYSETFAAYHENDIPITVVPVPRHSLRIGDKRNNATAKSELLDRVMRKSLAQAAAIAIVAHLVFWMAGQGITAAAELGGPAAHFEDQADAP